MVVIERKSAPNGFLGPFESVHVGITDGWTVKDTIVGWYTVTDRVVAYDPAKHVRLTKITVELTEDEVKARAADYTAYLHTSFASANNKFRVACKEALNGA